MNEKYQPIRDLFGYFHQDCNIYEDDWKIVLFEAFLDFQEKQLVQIATSIKALLQDKADQELEEMLCPDFHCNYIPSDDGMSTHQWLVEITEILEHTLAQRKRDGIGNMAPNYLKQIKSKGPSST
jgi:hypothetical protein